VTVEHVGLSKGIEVQSNSTQKTLNERSSKSGPSDQWPPAVELTETAAQDSHAFHAIDHISKLGKRSVWCSIAAIGSWGAAAIVVLIEQLEAGHWEYRLLLDTCFIAFYLLGPLLAVCGIPLGWHSKSSTTGKCGVVLGIALFLGMLGITLFSYVASGGEWIWNADWMGVS
jgi:hypothetical protein